MTVRPLRNAAIGLLAVLLAGLVPGSSTRWPLTSVSSVPPLPVPVPPAVQAAAREAGDAGQEFVDLDFMAGTPEAQEQLKEALVAAGSEVTLDEKTFVRARVPAAAAAAISEAIPGTMVGANQPLHVEPAQLTPPSSQVSPDQAGGLTVANYVPIGLPEFRREFGSQGDGIVVAVIDSGIDPGHPALQATPDGRPKLVDWKDFTREGYVAASQAVARGPVFVSDDGRQFQLPAVPAASRGARFGYLDEHNVPGAINQDLDRNGLKIDRFGVLLVDVATPGRYDTVYVDTNNDSDFRDEEPLQLYSTSHTYGKLGRNRAGQMGARRLNFAVASMDQGGSWVRLGFDGLGHGTQVAGVLGAYTPDNAFAGVAPGVQIMALKAIKSTGTGDWFDIKDAILYAARNGAKVINLSVGGLAAGAARIFDSGASDWLNQVAIDYGVLIVLAADNNGPGLSSGATLGNPSFVMAAGAYFSPEMWKRDYNWVVPHEGVWFFSGVGPRSDGTYLPSVVAPGGSTAPSPLWREATGYSQAVGTSIATPHVSGAAALLMETAQKIGYQADWLSVKRSLEMGARSIAGFGPYEQGHGLIQLRPALSHLQRINSVPNVRGRTPEGSGGLLARSYAPGSSAFLITNWEEDLVRTTVFSSEPWVKPAYSSLLLPSKVRRMLPVQLDPPQGMGVHSAFLQITSQNRYGSSLTLPVTYVRPVELGPANDYQYTQSATLEAGRYQRHFVKVQPGAASLSVTGRVTPHGAGSLSGTVQVHVFRPDGESVHSGRIGVAGDGLTTLFLTDDPVEGVWEVVVVALPDAREEFITPAYVLDVKTRPGALAHLPLRLNVEAGSVTTHQLTLNNPYAAFTGQVEAIGLSRAGATTQSVPWQVVQRLQSTVETFTLNQFTSEMQVEISNPVPSNTDLTLHLYRLDTNRGWELRGQSANPGTSNELIQLTYLPAGTYRVLVTGSSDTSLTFQYRRLVGSDDLNLSVQDSPRRHERGDTWSPTLTVEAPEQPGRYVGHVLLRDTERKRILGWYPIEVSVGQPAVRIQPLVTPLTVGKSGTVVLELRDSRTNQLVLDGAVTVNGLHYLSHKGQVVVPITPRASVQVLEVEANLPAYQFVRERMTLPVRADWGNYPLGFDSSEENTSWWRKVLGQLP
jgi:subtilisin family serine protease